METDGPEVQIEEARLIISTEARVMNPHDNSKLTSLYLRWAYPCGASIVYYRHIYTLYHGWVDDWPTTNFSELLLLQDCTDHIRWSQHRGVRNDQPSKFAYENLHGATTTFRKDASSDQKEMAVYWKLWTHRTICCLKVTLSASH